MGRERGGDPVRDEIGHKIDRQHHCHLHAQAVNGFRDGDLILVLEGIHRNGAGDPILIHAGDASLPCKIIDVKNAHNAGAEIAGCGDGKPEGTTAGEAHRLIGGADIVGLSGSLTVPHGQQDARGLKESGHHGMGKTERNDKTRDALDHIGAHNDRAAFEPYHVAGLLFRLLRHAEGKRNEADGNAVIGHILKERGVRNDDIQQLGKQQQKAAQHRRRHQTAANEGDLPAQNVRQKNGHGKNADLEHGVPKRGIGG